MHMKRKENEKKTGRRFVFLAYIGGGHHFAEWEAKTI